MAYRKREIDLPIETDFEFRRIESDVSVGEIVKKIIVGSGGSSGKAGVLYEKRMFYMNGGENYLMIDPYVENSVELYLNGLLEVKGVFYGEENPITGLIRLLDEVVNGDVITIKYIKR